MRKVAAALLCLVSFTVGAVHAQDSKKPPKPKPDCLDGVKYDDGKFEYGIRSSLFDDNFVMLFDPGTYPARLDKVCLAWRRSGLDREVWFAIRIWAADGPDGGPGTLIDTIEPVNASGISSKAKFFNYDVSGYGIVVDGPVYIGPFWDPVQYFLVYLGFDAGPKTARQRGFYNVGVFDDHPPQTEMGISLDAAPQYRALGVRAKFSPVQ